MKINSIQEQDDKTIHFTGELSPTEGALVVAMGLNTMVSLGLMHLLPGLDVDEKFNTEATH